MELYNNEDKKRERKITKTRLKTIGYAFILWFIAFLLVAILVGYIALFLYCLITYKDVKWTELPTWVTWVLWWCRGNCIALGLI